jgi:hypothetical protein
MARGGLSPALTDREERSGRDEQREAHSTSARPTATVSAATLIRRVHGDTGRTVVSAVLLPHVPAPGSHLDAVSLDAYVQCVKAAATHAARREIKHVARAKVVQHTAERRAKIVPGGRSSARRRRCRSPVGRTTGRRSLAPRAASGHIRSRYAGAWATRGRRQWWVRCVLRRPPAAAGRSRCCCRRRH